MCTMGDIAQCVISKHGFPNTSHRYNVSYRVYFGATYSFVSRYVFDYLTARDTTGAYFHAGLILSMLLK